MTKEQEEEQGRLFPKFSEERRDAVEQQIIEEQRVVDYDIREYPIEVLVQKYQRDRRQGQNEIFLPEYQRKFVWDTKKQSKFIESLMLGLPIPYLFTADNKGRGEIVDGSQRIRTLEAFLDNILVLENLKVLDKLNGFRYKDLHYARQLRFKKKTIRLIELSEKATLSVRQQLFERINTSSVILSDMEIRRGAFEGPFLELVTKLSKNVKFQMLCPISSTRESREEYEELILRFLAYSEKYLDFVHEVRGFIDNYAKEKNREGFDAYEIELKFEDMLDFVQIHFPYGFRKGENNRSVPRVRFEAISVGVHLALQEDSNLVPTPVIEWINSKEFKKHTTSDAANNRLKVVGRIEYVRDKLLGRI